MGNNLMQDITGAVPVSNRLNSYNADGFSLGTDTTVNTNGTAYYYLAVTDPAGTNFTHGTYSGSATGPRPIIAGLQPNLVMVWDDLGDTGGFRTSDMATDSYLDYGGTTGVLTDRILSLDTGGFTVDFRNETNGTGRHYYWVAFKSSSKLFKTFTYTGTGASNPITGVGFQPDFALTNNGSITPAAAALRFKDETGSNSFLATATGEGTTNITALGSDGVTVATGVNSNTTGTTYYAIAFKVGYLATDLSNRFIYKNYSNVLGDDGDYFIQFGSEYMIQNYKSTNTNSTDTPTFTWNGRTTYDTRVSQFLVQIFNVNSSTWETLANINSQPPDTDLSVSVSQTTNISNYYDSSNTVSFRTYQQVI